MRRSPFRCLARSSMLSRHLPRRRRVSAALLRPLSEHKRTVRSRESTVQLEGARPCTYSHRIPYESAKGGIYLILPSLARQPTLASLEIAASAENMRLKSVDATETHPNPQGSSARRPHVRSVLKPLYSKRMTDWGRYAKNLAFRHALI